MASLLPASMASSLLLPCFLLLLTSPCSAVSSIDNSWWSLSLPIIASHSPLSASELASSAFVLLVASALVCACSLLIYWSSPGGNAWGRLPRPSSIPGPRGLPLIGSLLDMRGLAHVRLAQLASSCSAFALMAFSLGNTRVVLTCVPEVAREILTSSAFADRPLKQSARQLLFDRAIGFAPYGSYWRNLRKIAASHLFAPKRIAAHEPRRQLETSMMLQAMSQAMSDNGVVRVRTFLQQASVNNIMSSVFGRTYNFGAGCEEAEKLQGMIREGFELLGAFNWADHLHFFSFFDTRRIAQRCAALVVQVKEFVQKIIDEHRQNPAAERNSELDFVDVLLSLDGADRLSDSDMIAVLWEMIFRGTDTTAILMEWIVAEVVLNPEVQRRAQAELDKVAGEKGGGCEELGEADVARLPYVQGVVKEAMRKHPPGPLLSWARLATRDVEVAGHRVPAGTTAMVNMWAITHDPAIWTDPGQFRPDRFLAAAAAGGAEIDLRGAGQDLRLAPFGAGRRVCPGRALGLATVHLWTARLLLHFSWSPHPSHPVQLAELLKLSCEMKTPLHVCATPRHPSPPPSSPPSVSAS